MVNILMGVFEVLTIRMDAILQALFPRKYKRSTIHGKQTI